jgi:hypothetical protein
LILDLPMDYVPLIRQAENEFIRKSHCIETMTAIATSGQNGGVLTNTYTLPTSFVEESRVEWEGVPLTQGHQASQNTILFDMEDNMLIGIPTKYWIETGSIRLNCKPSSHGNIRIWYSYFNTSAIGLTPMIPTNDHEYLKSFVFSILYRIETDNPFKDFNKGLAYENQFDIDCRKRRKVYQIQRFTQTTIEDVSENNIGGIQTRINLVKDI